MSNWYQSNILNQGGTPAVLTGNFANIPAAGYVGRLFVSKDTFAWYRDNGTTWDLIGGPGTGTITGSGAANQVAYFTSSGIIASSANLQFNGTVLTVANDATISGLAIGRGGGTVTGNTAIGLLALQNNTSGSAITAIGNAALRSNLIGTNCVAVGTNALLQSISNFNTAVGSFAMASATGGNNTGIGYNVLQTLFAGIDNVAIGANAGGVVNGSSPGNQNIYIGSNARSAVSSGNEIVIGANTIGAGDNTITIGNANHLNTYIRGALNISTVVVTKTASGIAVSIVDSGNGNALNINKTNSGFAINVAAGVSNFQNINVVDVVSTGSATYVGNIAAGGTTSAWAGGYNTVSVKLYADFYSNNDGFVGIAANTFFDDTNWVYKNTTNANRFESTLDKFVWYQAPSGTSGTAVTFVQSMTLTSSNNLLIGTSTDNLTDKLQINGSVLCNDITVSKNGSSNIFIKTTNDTTPYLQLNRNNLTFAAGFYVSNIGSIVIENLTGPAITVNNARDVSVFGSISTGAPTTGTAAPWKLGIYDGVTPPPPIHTGFVQVEINGVFYKLLAST